jgi:hypothetical protein
MLPENASYKWRFDKLRRLAVQTRKDGYSSTRDYQVVHAKSSKKLTATDGQNKIVFTQDISESEREGTIVGFGAFIFPDSPVSFTIELLCGDQAKKRKYKLLDRWNRVGCALFIDDSAASELIVVLSWKGKCDLSIWGLEADILTLPDGVDSSSVDVLNASHLSPETYYLTHDTAIDMDIDADSSTNTSIVGGQEICVKKCSYCQRLLPLNMDALGSLSFHKHKAKVTDHQNECRSCKKWRINNSFNPLRTTDQLHESSVITRERKLLLREPEILQAIKERTGAGLKSQIWERFDKKCFYCDTPVKLNKFQLDHTRPLAYLWPIDEHATCLCATHNNQKKDKFPVDFYNKTQLVQLSKVTGLPYEQLAARDVNEVELQRIIDDIVSFATAWDARTFMAIARKILEVRNDTDLVEILSRTSPVAYANLLADLEDRPAPVV